MYILVQQTVIGSKMTDKMVSVGKKIAGTVGGSVLIGGFMVAAASDKMRAMTKDARKRLEGDDRSAQNDINSPSPHK